ncbi:MAG: WG repeat-containing protein [Clostridia bacterium]|nr:WG repeat-containing protein [Clostridia bacterium]
MELFDEDFNVEEKTNNKKTTTIILAVIIFLIVMVLFVIGAIIYVKQSTLVVKVNGSESNTVKNMIRFDENNPQKIYVPIRRAAKTFGYNDFGGNYMTKSEEANQCYVECENEIAMFSLGSKQIYKKLTDEDSGYDVFSIDEPVKAIEGELYTTISGIEKAFNLVWNYNVEDKKMEIYTMPYLINSYSTGVTNLGYDGISEDFTNQKAILGGWLIVENGKDSNNKKVAVLSISNGKLETLLEPKYEEIDYLEHTNDFLVGSGGKKGIISNNKKTKIKSIYDDIKLIDYEKKLYEVKSSDKYGVIDFNGKIILDTYYNKIGIEDINVFKENDIRSKYILADSLIPVQKDKQWAFFDIRGKQVTDFKYDDIGYVTSNNRAGSSGYSLLVVPDYNVIIVQRDKKYNVITTTGEEVWAQFFFDSIYLSIDEGKTSYVLEIDQKTYNLTDQLDGLGYGKNKAQNNNERQSTSENNSNEQQDTEENNNNENNNNYQEEQQDNNGDENNEQRDYNNNEEYNENNNDNNDNNNNNNEDNNNEEDNN